MDGQPTSHLLGVVKLIGDGGAIVARNGVGVFGMRPIDELEGFYVVVWERLSESHCERLLVVNGPVR